MILENSGASVGAIGVFAYPNLPVLFTEKREVWASVLSVDRGLGHHCTLSACFVDKGLDLDPNLQPYFLQNPHTPGSHLLS